MAKFTFSQILETNFKYCDKVALQVLNHAEDKTRKVKVVMLRSEAAEISQAADAEKFDADKFLDAWNDDTHEFKFLLNKEEFLAVKQKDGFDAIDRTMGMQL